MFLSLHYSLLWKPHRLHLFPASLPPSQLPVTCLYLYNLTFSFLQNFPWQSLPRSLPLVVHASPVKMYGAGWARPSWTLENLQGFAWSTLLSPMLTFPHYLSPVGKHPYPQLCRLFLLLSPIYPPTNLFTFYPLPSSSAHYLFTSFMTHLSPQWRPPKQIISFAVLASQREAREAEDMWLTQDHSMIFHGRTVM